MNTFPYDSWYEGLLRAWEFIKPDPDNPGQFVQCLEKGVDGCIANDLYNAQAGYFTFGPGGNTASVIISILAIVLSVTMAVLVTTREDKVLNEAADRLADQYS